MSKIAQAKNRSAIATAGKTFRTKNISKRVQNIVISPIKEMSILADQFEEKNKVKLISFGQGIPYFDTPAYIKRGIRKALGELSTAKYTLEPGIPKLRELVAHHLIAAKKIRSVKSKKEVMIATGCQEAMACAIATVIDPGDEILLPEPAFASHIEQIIQFNGKPVFVPLIENEGWKIDIRECEKRVTKKTRALLISNPSNPTGAVLSRKEVRDIARLVKKHNLILITDETYDFLTYDGIRHISPASIPSIRDRVILCGSFSKKYALTGYRIGYAFADEGILDHMLKVHDALAICAPAISQKAAITALKGGEKMPREFVRKLSKNRNRMCRELDALSPLFSYQKPSGAYYVLVKVNRPHINSFKLALKILREAHVVVIPGKAFGPSGESHIRFSFAGTPENIKEGFRRLHAWIKKWGKSNYSL